MGRAALTVLILMLATGLGIPALAASASAGASATIVANSAVRLNWAIAMPTVNGANNGARFTGTVPSMMMAIMVMPGNERLTVRRDDVPGGLVTAPTSFEVISPEGETALLVRTTVDSESWLSSSGAILSGALEGGSAVSIDVAHGLMRITYPDVVGAAVQETLTVVVQYN